MRGARGTTLLLAGLLIALAFVLQGCPSLIPNRPPNAEFTANPTRGKAPLTVHFDASASSDPDRDSPDGDIVSYEWDFGDGETATGKTVEHTYTDDGSFEASLTVTDGKGAIDSDGETISVRGSTVYVTSGVRLGLNSRRDVVSVIDMATNTITATIDVEDRPSAIAITPDGETVYVATINDTVSVIDTTTNSVIRTINVGDGPLSITVVPDSSTVYVGNSDDTVSVIDTEMNAVTDTIRIGNNNPGRIGIIVKAIPDGTSVYALDSNGRTVSVIDTTTHSVLDTIRVRQLPSDITFTPDSSTAYVLQNHASPFTVSVIDTNGPSVIKTVNVGDSPTGMSITPDGSTVYVMNGGEDTVSVIDTNTNSVSDTITVGMTPLRMAVTPDNSTVYVSNSGDDTISVIDTATNSVIDTIISGSGPRNIAITPDSSRAYVANQNDRTVSVINTMTNSVIDTINIFGIPYDFAFDF